MTPAKVNSRSEFKVLHLKMFHFQKLFKKSIRETENNTRLNLLVKLGFYGALRPSSISIANMFSLCTLWNKQHKNFADLQKSNFVRSNFWTIRSSINLPWGHARSHKKFGSYWFSHFDVYWIQSNGQTSKIYIKIDRLGNLKTHWFLSFMF